MKVEIWSDVMCPYCYIGKRRFEAALQQFPERNNVNIEWKSFQLNPQLKTNPSMKINQYLADTKGWTLEYAAQISEQVTAMAAGEGLTYHMEQAIVANSFLAHRFSHMAAGQGLANEAEEVLFKAYFTDGKNTDDIDVLAELGSAIGMNADEIKSVLQTDAFSADVRRDLQEARDLGINAVPFFVFDRKYAISGAQYTQAFLDTLHRAFAGWQERQNGQAFDTIQGNACDKDGIC